MQVEDLTLSLNVVFETLGTTPVNVSIKEGREVHPLQHTLFGPDKSVKWFKQIFLLLQQLRYANKAPKRNTLLWQCKVKLLTVLIHLVLFQLLNEEPLAAKEVVQNILSASLTPLEFLLQDVNFSEHALVGAPLLVALWKTMKNEIDQIPVPLLANALKEEEMRVIATALKIVEIPQHDVNFEHFITIHSRRYQVTIFLLCELITVPPNLITPTCLQFMYLLGSYLEMEGSIAHDIATWQQPECTPANNSYLFWLKVRNFTQKDETHINQFLQETNKIVQLKKETLIAMRDQGAAPFFDVGLFLNAATKDIVEHYQDLMEYFTKAKF